MAAVWSGKVTYWDAEDDILWVQPEYGEQRWFGPFSAWKCKTPPVMNEPVSLTAEGENIVGCWRKRGTWTNFTDWQYCQECDAMTPHTKSVQVRTGAITRVTFDHDDTRHLNSTSHVSSGWCTECRKAGRI